MGALFFGYAAELSEDLIHDHEVSREVSRSPRETSPERSCASVQSNPSVADAAANSTPNNPAPTSPGSVVGSLASLKSNLTSVLVENCKELETECIILVPPNNN